MTKVPNNSENYAMRPRLYRVWVPLRDDGRAPLVSIWIDLIMTPSSDSKATRKSGSPQSAIAQSLRKLRIPCNVSALRRAVGG